jgi:hypothetical protein
MDLVAGYGADTDEEVEEARADEKGPGDNAGAFKPTCGALVTHSSVLEGSANLGPLPNPLADEEAVSIK